MSITNEEWNAGRTWEALEAQILTYLQKNQKPFNISAIVKGIGYREGKGVLGLFWDVVSVWAVRNALENLIEEGTVKARIIKQQIGEETYYKAT